MKAVMYKNIPSIERYMLLVCDEWAYGSVCNRIINMDAPLGVAHSRYKAVDKGRGVWGSSSPNVFETYIMIHCNDKYIFFIHITHDTN